MEIIGHNLVREERGSQWPWRGWGGGDTGSGGRNREDGRVEAEGAKKPVPCPLELRRGQ